MLRFPYARSLLTTAAALLLVLGSVTSASAKPDTMLQLEGTKERIAKFRADAKRLARLHMPGTDVLGEGWFRPWEAPRGIPGVIRSEDYFWRRFKVNDAWAQYFGMKDAEIVEAIKARMEPIFAQMAGQPIPDDVKKTIPPEVLKLMTSKPGMLSIPMMNLRKHTMLVHEPQVLAVTRLEDIGHRVIQARFNAEPEEAQQVERDLMPEILKVLGANLGHLSYEEALAALAREARSVRRSTEMSYIHADPAALKDTSGKTLPTYAVFRVKLYVAAHSAIGTSIKDVNAANVTQTAARLTASLRKTMGMAKEIGQRQLNKQIETMEQELARAERANRDTTAIEQRIDALREGLSAFGQVQNIKADIKIAEHGDSAWVMSLENLPTVQSKKLGAFQARLRNGNAIVDIQAEGTYPKAFMKKHLEYLLASLDESTQVFAE